MEWVNKGAKPSNSVAKFLIANKITHKHIVFIPDAPGKKKSKSGDKGEQKSENKVDESAKKEESSEQNNQGSENENLPDESAAENKEENVKPEKNNDSQEG